jgi:hypothetical protein
VPKKKTLFCNDLGTLLKQESPNNGRLIDKLGITAVEAVVIEA